MAEGYSPEPVKLEFETTLEGDVITTANNMPNHSIRFYYNSNKPNNRPTDLNWGAYLFIKGNGSTSAIYMDSNHMACVYGIQPSSTSLNWHIT